MQIFELSKIIETIKTLNINTSNYLIHINKIKSNINVRYIII